MFKVLKASIAAFSLSLLFCAMGCGITNAVRFQPVPGTANTGTLPDQPNLDPNYPYNPNQGGGLPSPGPKVSPTPTPTPTYTSTTITTPTPTPTPTRTTVATPPPPPPPPPSPSPTPTAVQVSLGKTYMGVFEAGIANTSAQNYYASQTKALHADTVRLSLPIYINYQKSSLYYQTLAPMMSEISAFKAQGIKVTLTVSGTLCKQYYACPPFPASGEFGNFISGLLADLGKNCATDSNCPLNGIHAMEIGNEWDDGYGYSPGNTPFTPAQYFDLMLKEAYMAIKQVRPDILVYSGSVVMNHEYMLTDLAKMGATFYADAFGYHPYAENSADLLGRIQRAQAAIKAAKTTDMPIILTEWGCDSSWENCAQWSKNFSAAFAGIKNLGVLEADYYLLAQVENAYNMSSFSLLTNAGSSGARTESTIFNLFQAAASQ